MLTAWQVECPSVTPSVVLEASGHVERFTDFMVRDVPEKSIEQHYKYQNHWSTLQSTGGHA